MQTLQFQEEGQVDPPLLVGCPGCPKCLQYHGYLFHLSAGRCTKAHEYLFLLTKSARYYFDADAIKERCSDGTHERRAENGVKMPDGWDTGAGGHGSFHRNGREKGKTYLPGNKTHKGTTAYLEGDERQRTKAGLVDYATRMRANYKGSIPGRHDGPGQDRRQPERKMAEAGSGIKNNDSFDAAMAIMPEKRNKRSVWTVSTESFSEAHFATFPTELIKPCILAGCPAGGTVLDPFAGSLTTMKVAEDLNCKSIGIELNAAYIDIGIRCRLKQSVLNFTEELPCSNQP